MYYFCIIYGNFFLYKYLEKHTENNKAVKEADKKKDRQRNIIPARASFHCVGVLVTSFMVFTICYSIPVRGIKTNFKNLTKILQNKNFDSSTRAYVLAIFCDLYPCILGISVAKLAIKSISTDLIACFATSLF